MSNNPEFIGWKVGIDDSDLNAAVARVNATVEKLLSKAPQSIDKATVSLSNYQRAIEQLTSRINASNLKDKEKQAAIEKLDKAYEQLAFDAEAAARAQQRGSTGVAIPTAQVTQSANTLNAQLQASNTALQNEAAKATQQHANAHETLSNRLDLSSRSLRFSARELVNVVGGGNQAIGVIGGLVSAFSLLDAALVIASALALKAKETIDADTAVFKKESIAAAQGAKSLEEYLIQKQRIAQTKPLQANAEDNALIEQATKLASQRSGDSFFIKQGEFEKALKELQQQQFANGQLLGKLSDAQVESTNKEILKLAEEGVTLDQLVPKVQQLRKEKGLLILDAEEETAAELRAAKAYQILGLEQSRIKKSQHILVVIEEQRIGAGQLANKTVNEVQDAQSKRNEELATAQADFQTRIADIDAKGAERRGQIARDFNQRITEINDNLHQSEIDAAASFNDRIEEAEAAASEHRAQIAAQAIEKIADAEKAAQERRIEILANVKDRIAEAEDSANERRAEIAKNFAERREQIEQQFQDSLKHIQTAFASSVFDAASRVDAKALIQAQLARAQQLKDAEQQKQKENDQSAKERDKQNDAIQKALEKQREKINDEAEKQRRDLEKNLAHQREQINKEAEKQRKDLAANLAKQEEKLKDDYEKRLVELEKSAARQRTAEGKNFNKQEADLARSLADQHKAERESYDRRQRDIEKSFDNRLKTIGDALGKEKDLYGLYGAEIRKALSDALSPNDFAAIVNAAEKELNRRIEVKLLPLVTPKEPPPDIGPTPYALGGYIDRAQRAILHAGEFVVPNPQTAGISRFSQVVGEMSSTRAQALTQSFGGSAGAMNGKPERSDLYLHVDLNDAMLDVRIDDRTHSELFNLITEARRR